MNSLVAFRNFRGSIFQKLLGKDLFWEWHSEATLVMWKFKCILKSKGQSTSNLSLSNWQSKINFELLIKVVHTEYFKHFYWLVMIITRIHIRVQKDFESSVLAPSLCIVLYVLWPKNSLLNKRGAPDTTASSGGNTQSCVLVIFCLM